MPGHPTDADVERLTNAVHLLIRALLVAGRSGAPAEGKLPFNPLYFHFLGVLYVEGDMRPSALADKLGIARTSLSTASKALQARSLICQTADPDDGRAQRVALTKEGRLMAEAIRRQDRRNMRNLLQLVDEKRSQVVIEVLDEVTQKLYSNSSG